MAERLLYGNNSEPLFPFDSIRPHLSWLPSYLETHSSDRDLDEPLLNTVMVFARARTSALLPLHHLSRVAALTQLLNSVARRVPGGSHHLLEIDKVGTGSFFVTCKRSTRYQWRRPMSHVQIGRNLDYFAPGHMMMDPEKKRTVGVHFVNKDNLQNLTGEAVFLEALKDPKVREEFERFNQAKERLFNTVCEELGLKDRFKCVLVTADILETVIATMTTCQSLPDPGWWEANCYLVNCIHFLGVNPDPKYNFCGYQTNYEQHWPLICMTFYFVLGYKRIEYQNSTNASSRVYWEAMHSVLVVVKEVCEEDITDDYDCVVKNIEKKFEELAELAQTLKTDPGKEWEELARRQTAMMKANSRNERHLIAYKKVARICRLHVRERYKLKSRLIRISLEYPQSGNQLVFS